MTSPGSGTATEALFRDLHGRLFAFLRARVASPEDAEDLLQEIFARIHERAERLEEIESVSSFVYRAARNAVTDYYRRRDAATRRSEALAEQGDRPSDAQDPAAELAGCLTPFLERLPPRYREVLELTELQGWTQQRAADHLGLSLSGVKSRVSRGREKLKALLLDCCHVELDRRKGIADYSRRSTSACSCGRLSELVTLERNSNSPVPATARVEDDPQVKN